MLILLEANYPIPLVNALREALLLYPSGPIRVERDSPTVEEDTDSRTVVFMMNKEQKVISPAICDRYRQEYRIIAYRKKKGEVFDPYRFVLQVLSLLPKIIEVIEADQQAFVYFLQLGNRSLRKSEVPSVEHVSLQSKKRQKRVRPGNHMTSKPGVGTLSIPFTEPLM